MSKLRLLWPFVFIVFALESCGDESEDDSKPTAGSAGKASGGSGGGTGQGAGTGGSGTSGNAGESSGGGAGANGGNGGGGSLPLGPTFASLKENVFLVKGCNNCHGRLYQNYERLIEAKPSTSAPSGGNQSCQESDDYQDKTIIQKGSAETSLLYIKVALPSAEQNCGERMPQADPEEPLTQEEIEAIKQWIDNGAENN